MPNGRFENWMQRPFSYKKPKEHVLKSRNKPTRIFSQDSQRDHMESMIYKLDNINRH